MREANFRLCLRLRRINTKPMTCRIPLCFCGAKWGQVEWYVRDQGYVYVHMDVRGSGQSGGTYNMLDKEEQQDLYECIEWVARQDWCSGKVGGWAIILCMVAVVHGCLEPASA